MGTCADGTRGIQSALRGYREKDKELRDALFRSPSPPPGTTTAQPAGESSAQADPIEPISRASAVRDLESDMDMEEEDYEAMIAAAEQEAAAAQSAIAGGSAEIDQSGAKGQGDEEEDFEAMIAAAEAEAEEAHRNAGSAPEKTATLAQGDVENGQSGTVDEYEDDWAAMDGL